MRNARKRQNGIRNCFARNSEISELSLWPSKLSSLREKKIRRVGNPCSEYYNIYVRPRNLCQERLGS